MRRLRERDGEVPKTDEEVLFSWEVLDMVRTPSKGDRPTHYMVQGRLKLATGEFYDGLGETRPDDTEHTLMLAGGRAFRDAVSMSGLIPVTLAPLPAPDTPPAEDEPREQDKT